MLANSIAEALGSTLPQSVSSVLLSLKDVVSLSVMDRYQLSHSFETERIRRSIMGCGDIDSLRTITLKLLQMCEAQKMMLCKLMLPGE